MTMVSTYDGRVLWHVRDHIDLEADRPQDIERMVHTFLDTLPPALPRPAVQAPAPAALPSGGKQQRDRQLHPLKKNNSNKKNKNKTKKDKQKRRASVRIGCAIVDCPALTYHNTVICSYAGRKHHW